MAGTACWKEKCPMCSGKSKLTIWDKKEKKISSDESCPACDGRGYLFIKRFIDRKKV
jgi:hypothetical protein